MTLRKKASEQRRLSAQGHWREMCRSQDAPQEVGARVAHAAHGRVSEGWHMRCVQVDDDEVKLIALDFMHSRAVTQADGEINQARMVWVMPAGDRQALACFGAHPNDLTFFVEGSHLARHPIDVVVRLADIPGEVQPDASVDPLPEASSKKRHRRPEL